MPLRCFRVKQSAFSAVAAAILALGITASPANAQRDARAEQLITGWINAAGGPRIWDSVRDLRYTITTVWYDSTGTEVRRRPRLVWVKKPATHFSFGSSERKRRGGTCRSGMAVVRHLSMAHNCPTLPGR